MSFFVEQYEDSVIDFWLTPGIPFLSLYFFILFYFLHIKRVLLAFAMLVPLFLSFAAVFLTTDGLRVFSVTIASAYILILREFVNNIFPNFFNFYKKIKLLLELFLNKYKFKDIYIVSGLIISIMWYLLIERAKSKGLFMNELPLLSNTFFSVNYYFLGIWIASIAIFKTITLPFLRRTNFIFQCMKMIFILPLLLILFQYLRITFYPDQVFSFDKKIYILILLLLCTLIFLKINMLRLLDLFNDQIIRLYRFIFSLS
jgi:hypothetical protein